MVKLMHTFTPKNMGARREKSYRPNVGLTTWRKHRHEHPAQYKRSRAFRMSRARKYSNVFFDLTIVIGIGWNIVGNKRGGKRC